MTSNIQETGSTTSVPAELAGYSNLHAMRGCDLVDFQPSQDATPYWQRYDGSTASDSNLIGTHRQFKYHQSPSDPETSWMQQCPPLGDSTYSTWSPTANAPPPLPQRYQNIGPPHSSQFCHLPSDEEFWGSFLILDPQPDNAMRPASSPASPFTQELLTSAKTPKSVVSSANGSAGSIHLSAQPTYRTAADMIKIAGGHEDTMYHFVEKWKGQDHVPTKNELEAMAKVVHLSLAEFSMWFGAKVQLAPDMTFRQSNTDARNMDQALPPDIAEHINAYILKHNLQSCKRSAESSGFYRCTWDCGYSANKRDQWEQHEATKQPQQFWICADCRSGDGGDPRCPHVNHRGDKFLEHAKIHAKIHRDDPKYRYKLRDRSEVKHVAPFHRNCKWAYNYGTCNQHFSNWKERNDHYVRHFEENSGGCRVGNRKRQFSSKDESERVERSDKKRKLPARSGLQEVIPAPDSSPAKISGSPSEAQVTSSTSLIPKHHHVSTFIDVFTFKLVEADLSIRYLAMNYDSVVLHPPFESSASSQADACMWALQAMSQPLREAIMLTREMGVTYLWIGVFSDETVASHNLENIYSQALFVIVVGMLEKSSLMTQFACTHDKMGMVRAWMQHNVTFRHLHVLGQGSYSVVDKVEINCSKDTILYQSATSFARKTVVRRQSWDSSLRSTHLREIEIMRKFNHPHIAQFVAAYYQDNTLNILMSPVADCDLRQYLNEPQRFPTEGPFLSRWFSCLAEALTHIHGLDCRHKDIKPANILISNHQVLLTDFGTSTQFTNDESSTSGDTLLTPKYCAPEVAAKGQRGRSADIWSLGCVFLEMLTVLEHKSLADLHAAVKIESVSADRHHTYHSQRLGVLSWLREMQTIEQRSEILRVISCTESMLREDPILRPKATEVVQALCSQRDCERCGRVAEKPVLTGCHCTESSWSAETRRFSRPLPLLLILDGSRYTRLPDSNRSISSHCPIRALLHAMRVLPYDSNPLSLKEDSRFRDVAISDRNIQSTVSQCFIGNRSHLPTFLDINCAPSVNVQAKSLGMLLIELCIRTLAKESVLHE